MTRETSNSDYKLNGFNNRPTDSLINDSNKKKTIMIIFGISLLVLIIGAGIFFLVKWLQENEKEKIGEINCIFQIDNTEVETSILGKDFKHLNSISVYYDDEKLDNPKKYKFPFLGLNKIRIDIYENLNMDNMFKNVVKLQIIEMITSNNIKINSMESSFENCVLLNNFTMEGFDLSEVKSVSKLFYGTNITILPTDTFLTSNVEDFSFMFASTNVLNVNLTNFNTSNAKNMYDIFFAILLFKL